MYDYYINFIHILICPVGDYFAVRLQEDPVYATPIFTTMGGMSKCPGETLTSARQSGVKLMIINSYCGPGRNETCLNLKQGETAYFGAVVENLSPTCKYNCNNYTPFIIFLYFL